MKKTFYILLIILFCSCNKASNNDVPVNILSDKTDFSDYDISFEQIATYGSDDEDYNYIFGLILDFCVDKSQNVYVLDRTSSNVRKFDKSGKYVQTYGAGPGQGPGELITPRSMALDSYNNIFVTDRLQKSITKFYVNADSISRYSLNYFPADILIDANNSIYVENNALSYSDNKLIKKYDQNMNFKYDFCRPWSDPKIGDLVIRSGNCGNKDINQQDQFVYCTHYPYQILTYDTAGVLITKDFRELSFLKPPFPQQKKEISTIGLPSRVTGFAYFNDIYKIIVLRKKTNDKYEYIFDFYKNDKLISSQPHTKYFKHPWIRIVRSDSEGHLYFDVMEPYPHIVKYKMTICEKSPIKETQK